MIRDFRSIVGYEARKHSLEMTGIIPGKVCTCMDTDSNSIGMFKPLLNDPMGVTGVEHYGYGDQFMG